MLIIKRENSYIDRYRVYKVFIDGKYYGKIRNNACINIDISLGNHNVQLKVDWCQSKTLSVNITEGEDVCLICYPKNKGQFFLKNLFASIINAKEYIILDWK